VLAVPDRIQLGQLAADGEEGHVRVSEAEGREPLELLAEAERQLTPTHHGVDGRDAPELVLGEGGRGLGGEGLREGLQALRCDREPGGGAVAPPAAEEGGARAERAVEVEGRDRAAGSGPLLPGLAAGHEDDRTVEAFHEPRGDDPDHAAVPVLARDHVPQAAPPRLRPFLDLADGVPQDPLLHGLAVAVQLLELAGEAPRLAGVVREQ
jgi:hypothetical protein